MEGTVFQGASTKGEASLSEYTMTEIRPTDRHALQQLDQLLAKEKISRDRNLDYTAGLFDEEFRLVATGSCFANTLRCLAVDDAHQGEGLMNQIITHLMEYQMQRGNARLFLYTKCDKTMFFSDLGFYEIARVEDRVAFMENRKNGFSAYLDQLAAQKKEGRSAALVMNCNPFTLGHRYLVEKTANENDVVHLFVVSEDASFFPFSDRYALVAAGCADLRNVILHQTGSYMISSAVFPSYFLQDEQAVIEAHARLDLALFQKIAGALGVSRRYVGEEPFSLVTGIYNQVMQRELPKAGIECVVIPRKEQGGQAISASVVRQRIHDGKLEEIRPLVPPSTFAYFSTEAGQETIRKIQAAVAVVHY